jgi:hypothetical protein
MFVVSFYAGQELEESDGYWELDESPDEQLNFAQNFVASAEAELRQMCEKLSLVVERRVVSKPDAPLEQTLHLVCKSSDPFTSDLNDLNDAILLHCRSVDFCITVTDPNNNLVQGYYSGDWDSGNLKHHDIDYSDSINETKLEVGFEEELVL